MKCLELYTNETLPIAQYSCQSFWSDTQQGILLEKSRAKMLIAMHIIKNYSS